MVAVNATLRCPHCGHEERMAMPVDQCVVVYDCPACARTLRPRAGDCCVFCSYADRPCPSIQETSPKRLQSHADNLRQVIEVFVSCMQGNVVLQHKSGQPHIVCRNRRALSAELAED